jgi:hypothetical protein
MNESIKAGENFGFSLNGNAIEDIATLEPGTVYGRTKIYKNDVLVHNDLKALDADGFTPNAIVGGSGTTSPTGLKAYFAESMSSAVDRALNDLFDDDEIEPTGSGTTQTDKDGIIVAGALGVFGGAQGAFTTVTTSIAAANTYGRKWRGVISPGTARQFGAAKLGYSLTNAGDFVTSYATQQFPTQTLAANDTLTIEWEVFIA